jgi:hypothetical protein
MQTVRTQGCQGEELNTKRLQQSAQSNRALARNYLVVTSDSYVIIHCDQQPLAIFAGNIASSTPCTHPKPHAITHNYRDQAPSG